MQKIIASILNAMFDRLKHDARSGLRAWILSENFLNGRQTFKDYFAAGVIEMTCAAIQTVLQIEQNDRNIEEYREIIKESVHEFVLKFNKDNSTIPDIDSLVAKLCGDNDDKVVELFPATFSNGKKVRLKKNHYVRADDESTCVPAGASGVIEGYGPYFVMMRMNKKYPFLPDNCIVWQDDDGPLAEQLSEDIELDY